MTDITLAVQQLCTDKLVAGTDLCALMDALHTLVEETLYREHPPAQRRHLACAAGCRLCCQVHVSVLQPEARRIARFLQEEIPRQEFTEVREKMGQLSLNIADVDEEDRIAMHRYCAFLSPAGWCRIYPVRPLLCRALTSTDRRACEEQLYPGLEDPSHPLVSYLPQQEIMQGAFVALGEGLSRAGLSAVSTELTAAVLEALEATTDPIAE